MKISIKSIKPVDGWFIPFATGFRPFWGAGFRNHPPSHLLGSAVPEDNFADSTGEEVPKFPPMGLSRYHNRDILQPYIPVTCKSTYRRSISSTVDQWMNHISPTYHESGWISKYQAFLWLGRTCTLRSPRSSPQNARPRNRDNKLRVLGGSHRYHNAVMTDRFWRGK